MGSLYRFVLTHQFASGWHLYYRRSHRQHKIEICFIANARDELWTDKYFKYFRTPLRGNWLNATARISRYSKYYYSVAIATLIHRTSYFQLYDLYMVRSLPFSPSRFSCMMLNGKGFEWVWCEWYIHLEVNTHWSSKLAVWGWKVHQKSGCV